MRVFGIRQQVVAYVCECADPACRRAVPLTRDEYETLRTHQQAILYPAKPSRRDAHLSITLADRAHA